MKNPELKKAQKAIKTVAEKESMSEAEIRREMKAAIAEGLRSADPDVQEMWKKVPCRGEVPDPEEVIAWLAERMRERLKA